MSRYSTLVLDKPNPTTKTTTVQDSKRHNKSQTIRTSKTTKRCECCGLEYTLDKLVSRHYDPLNRVDTKVCVYCNKYYSDGTILRYSYSIQETPANWLTYSYTKKESRF